MEIYDPNKVRISIDGDDCAVETDTTHSAIYGLAGAPAAMRKADGSVFDNDETRISVSEGDAFRTGRTDPQPTAAIPPIQVVMPGQPAQQPTAGKPNVPTVGNSDKAERANMERQQDANGPAKVSPATPAALPGGGADLFGTKK